MPPREELICSSKTKHLLAAYVASTKQTPRFFAICKPLDTRHCKLHYFLERRSGLSVANTGNPQTSPSGTLPAKGRVSGGKFW
jgi:hypothetical protein